MLLFIIILYLRYGLIECDSTVKANFKESLIIDNYHRKRPQVNAFLKENKNISAVFHPSPKIDPFDRSQGLSHWLRPVLAGFNLPLPPSGTQSSSPYPIPVFPLQNPSPRPSPPRLLLSPMNSVYATDYGHQNIYLRPPDPYISRLSYIRPPRPENLPFFYAINAYLEKHPGLINPPQPTISPLISDPASIAETSLPVIIPSSSKWTTTIGYNAKIWMNEIALYTSIKKLKKPSTEHSPGYQNGKTTVSLTNRTPKINEYWFPNLTTNTGQVFNEEIKVTTPSSISQKQRYLDLMEQLNEGYMMVFLIELSRMIALKDRWEVREVLHHTEIIYNKLWDNGRLKWIEDPLETVIWKMAILMSGRDIDVVQTYASMMFHTLRQRKETLSTEVNIIIDEADLFYNHDEGDRLLNSLKEFEDYPKTLKNSYWLCDSLIESFLLPFRRLSGTRRRQRLIDSINNALKQRFPQLLREHNHGTVAGQVSPKNGSRHRKRKKKRRHSSKKKRVRVIHRIPEYLNKNVYVQRAMMPR